MRKKRWLIELLTGAIVLAVAILLFSSLLMVVNATQNDEYVGAEKCKLCHQEQYDDWLASGHAHKLRTVEEAKKAGLPKPSNVDWDEIKYVIGGFKWKARYIGTDGYIITKNGPVAGQNQFNLQTDSWSDYHPGEKKPYNCGKCHTTGYSSEGHQDGLEGIVGTWALPNIQCEACHGPGKKHTETVSEEDITVDDSSELCGKCHVRGDPEKIPAKGGFIRHHEQYNELLSSPHKNLSCDSCHEPHKRAGLSIKLSCESCHPRQKQEFTGSTMQLAGLKCVDCHMPKAVKSAVGFAWKFEGDIKSHLFAINTDPQAKMFTADGKYAQGYLTVEYACLNCHVGQSKEWALKYAEDIHEFKSSE